MIKIPESNPLRDPVLKAREPRVGPAEEVPPLDSFSPRPAIPLLGEGPRTPASPPPPPPGPLTVEASRYEASQNDEQSAREILERVAAMRRLTDQRIQAMFANLSTQIFDMWQEVMARRQKACQDSLDRWNKVMFGS